MLNMITHGFLVFHTKKEETDPKKEETDPKKEETDQQTENLNFF